MSALFTCITCQVAYVDPNLQKEHYKTDWHRYNSRRRVAELPPVTSESFVSMVTAHKLEAEKKAEEASIVRYCSFCRRNYGTANSLENHLQSKRHAENVAKHDEKVRRDTECENAKNAYKSGFKMAPTPAAQTTGGATAAEPRSSKVNTGKIAGSSATSKIMARDDDYDDDEDDMDEWDDMEGDPLGLEECLFCSFQSATLEDNVKHMTEIHSFFIPDIEYLVDLEGLISLLAEKVGIGYMCLWCNEKSKTYYSVKSVQQHMEAKGHCMMLHEGPTLEEYADFYDYSSSYPDAEEADPDGQAVAVAKISAVEMDGDQLQMALPSGVVIGHRALMRYYKQHVRPLRPAPNKKLLNNVMSHYRGLGWTGTTGAAAVQNARNISLMHIRRSRNYLRLGINNNQVMQKHFRHQNPL